MIDRILRLKSEQDALAADIREVYAEAKAGGFDKTVMGLAVARLRKEDKKGASEMEVTDSMLDLYLQAYRGETGTEVATRAHTREAAPVTPPHESETEEITEPPEVNHGHDVPVQAGEGGSSRIATENALPATIPDLPPFLDRRHREAA